jgi:hypothetical protein
MDFIYVQFIYVIYCILLHLILVLFRFFGNVTVGKDITIQELQQHYHAIILAYGADDDRKLNIKGEK